MKAALIVAVAAVIAAVQPAWAQDRWPVPRKA